MDSKQNISEAESKLRNNLSFEFDALSQNLSLMNFLNFGFATLIYITVLFFIKKIILRTEIFVDSLRDSLKNLNFKGLVVLEAPTIFKTIIVLHLLFKY